MPHEEEVDVPGPFEDVPKLSAEAVALVQRWISNEAHIGPGRENRAQGALGLPSIALTPSLGSVNLNEAHSSAVVEPNCVAVEPLTNGYGWR